MKTVLIPLENKKDLTEIPAKVREGLTIIPVEQIMDALPHVFSLPRKQKKAGR
jgi:ATP-dependent Lon protease